MATGVLASVTPSATTITTLYTVPAAKKAIVNITVVNTGASAVTFRIYLKSSASAPGITDAVFYNVSLAANGVPYNWTGVAMATTNTISCYASTTGVNFQVTGIEEGA